MKAEPQPWSRPRHESGEQAGKNPAAGTPESPQPGYLYWMVSDVVDARSLVMRMRTMLNRKMKLI